MVRELACPKEASTFPKRIGGVSNIINYFFYMRTLHVYSPEYPITTARGMNLFTILTVCGTCHQGLKNPPRVQVSIRPLRTGRVRTVLYSARGSRDRVAPYRSFLDLFGRSNAGIGKSPLQGKKITALKLAKRYTGTQVDNITHYYIYLYLHPNLSFC